MKKTLSIIMTISILISLSTFILTSCSNTLYTAASPANRPDWVITEVSPDQAGSGVGGWSDGKDCMEFIEIYNNSGVQLDLYDYCLTYNGTTRTDEKFENQIVEITPFLPGDYLDGTVLPWTGQAIACGDLSNKPVNPETCLVETGEIIVLWIVYHEAYYDLWNEGKGLSVSDFRTFWGIPEGVKVIAVDGCSNTDHGGNSKNFNIKNSAVATYGIALYSEALNAAANTNPGSDDVFQVIYTESVELATWVTIDFNTQLLAASISNFTFNFTVDNQGYDAGEFGYVQDARRMSLILPYVDAVSEFSVGTLLPIQKLTLGVPMEAGESCEFIDSIRVPNADLGEFEGFVIDDILYHPGTTFTAETAGTYNLIFKFANDDITVSDSVTLVPESTTVPNTTTEAPDTTTVKDATDGTTTVSDTTSPLEGGCAGCRSTLSFGVLTALLPAAYFISRKRKY